MISQKNKLRPKSVNFTSQIFMIDFFKIAEQKVDYSSLSLAKFHGLFHLYCSHD